MSKKMNSMYKSLVSQVRKIDRKAANWLRDEAPEMESFVPTDKLSRAFEWAASPQGHEYWRNMFKKIYGYDL